MSEYQYYAFRAIDRPLGKNETDELRRLSTRAEITPTSLTNTYNYGDFKGDPNTLMDRYFDAFVYVANWGTHRLMFRIPTRFLDVEAASAYCDGEVLSLKAGTEHVVLEFESQEEGDDEWTDGDEWMASMISVRADLMRGDLRAMYIGWLATIESGAWNEADADQLEPPVPPGLAKLSAPLQDLADFLRVDDELIEAAASGSVGEPPAEPSREESARWIKGLPASDKDAYLLRFLTEEGDLLLRAELSKRFREATRPKDARPAPEAVRRSVAQLLAARDGLAEAKDRKATEHKAKERARLEREQEEARGKYLDGLAPRQASAWTEVEELIATKLPKNYDRAVTLLVDLRDLAARSGRASEVQARIDELRERHGQKRSLLQRLDTNKLGM